MPERYTSTATVELVTDPDEKAAREAENGLRQASLALEVIRTFVKDSERKFRLRQGLLMQLHHEALAGIHIFAGTFRNGPAEIHGSHHEPPSAFMVGEEVSHMCEFVNDSWNKSAVFLSSYVLWRLNWIHPFADGNGRTARALSYIVLNVRLDSLLPGTKTIPDFISADKTPYYDALESADLTWKQTGTVDVSKVESLVEATLAKQLLQAAQEAVTDD
jgi:Fic family protein